MEELPPPALVDIVLCTNRKITSMAAGMRRARAFPEKRVGWRPRAASASRRAPAGTSPSSTTTTSGTPSDCGCSSTTSRGTPRSSRRPRGFGTWTRTGDARERVDRAPRESEYLLRGLVAFPHIGTLMVRRSVVDEVGPFDPSYTLGEDNEWIARLLCHGQTGAVERELLGYRRHAGSTMAKASPARQRAADERLLTARIGATRSSDPRASAWLVENLRRYRAGAAADRVGQIRDAARDRDVARLVEAARWALSRSPVSFGRALWTRAVARSQAAEAT
jgi:hypothetical protein